MTHTTHKIQHTSINSTVEFKIGVKNNNILKAHSQSFRVIGYTVSSTYLVLNNSKKATYTLNCRNSLQSWSKKLICEIEIDGNISVSFI